MGWEGTDWRERDTKIYLLDKSLLSAHCGQSGGTVLGIGDRTLSETELSLCGGAYGCDGRMEERGSLFKAFEF